MFEKPIRVLRDDDPPNPGPGGDPAPKDGDDGKGKPITMPSGAFEDRLNDARTRAKRELEAELVASGRLLSTEDAKQLADDRETKRKEDEKKRQQHGNEAVQALAAEKDKLINEARQKSDALAKELDETRIDVAASAGITDLALAEGVKSEHLLKLIKLRNELKTEDGQVVVFDDKGARRYSIDNPGEWMTANEYVKFIARKEFSGLLAPAGKAGTGNTTNRPNGRAVTLPPNHESREVWDTLTPEQKALAKANSGLGPTDKPTGNPYHKVPAK